MSQDRAPLSRSPARLDKAALFAHVGYVPHLGQAAVHASQAATRVLACGVRWGKSRCAVMECLAAAIAPGPAALGWIVAPSFDVVDRLLSELTGDLARVFRHRLVSVERRERRVVVRNLSDRLVVIEGKRSTKVEGLLGASLDFVIVDEAGRVSDDAWETALSQRLVDRGGWALISGTPRAEGSWFHRLFLLGRGGDSSVESWTAPTASNPAIDPALIERERSRLSASEFGSEYGGQFVGPYGPGCLTCGGPHRGCRTTIVLLPGETLAVCPDCLRPLDHEGQPIGMMLAGELVLTTIETDDVQPPMGG